jgi:hypothetical protein
MGKIVGLWLGTIASLAGLLYSCWPQQHTIWFTTLLTLLVVLVVLLIYNDVANYILRLPHVCASKEQIATYMFNWISRGGRVIVFTRDMTWAIQPNIENLLLAKARQNELTIYMPKPTDLSKKLELAGATVFHYQALNFIPSSRFTIINADRMDAHVAIGGQQDGKHVIEEYRAGQHPVFAVIHDLTEVIRRYAN